MPTVLKIKDYRFFFFSREELRQHIHIQCQHGEAKFWLDPQIELAKNYKLTKKEIEYIKNFKLRPNIHNQQSANQYILNTAPLKSLKKFIQQKYNDVHLYFQMMN